jgi:hypothetical protein
VPHIRHITWTANETFVDPAAFNYDRDDEILGAVKAHIAASGKFSLRNNHVALVTESEKKFTKDHLKQLVVARGFLPVICEWLTPEQVEDPQLRAKVAVVQHLLNEIWGDLA